MHVWVFEGQWNTSSAGLKIGNILELMSKVSHVFVKEWSRKISYEERRRGQVKLLRVTGCHGCALCIRPLPSVDPCYCGDRGPWVTDGCWGVSVVVKGTKCVNHSQWYKECKGYADCQKKHKPVCGKYVRFHMFCKRDSWEGVYVKITSFMCDLFHPLHAGIGSNTLQPWT